ncbi:MAG: GcrA family cell cycle regulator [Xanthobacteraceae bacterium]
MRGAWMDDDIDLLKRLWAAGETAETIAARLGGLTRSAVLGKIFRLRLGPAPGGATPKAKAAKKPEAVARRRGGPEPQPVPKPKSPICGKSLFDLTNNCCRWPYRRPGTEKYFFCGVEEADLEEGKPYCDRHMKRAYVVLPNTGARPARKDFRAARGGRP